MDQLFPSMNSKPEKIQLFALIPAWLWVFVLLPMFMPFVGLGLWEQTELSVWLEIGYHVANGIAMLLLLLRERWNWRRLHESVLLAMGYAALCALLMQLGRLLVALVLSYINV